MMSFSLVHVWGCNGYGRMGLGTGLQNDVLVPKVVPSVSLFIYLNYYMELIYSHWLASLLAQIL